MSPSTFSVVDAFGDRLAAAPDPRRQRSAPTIALVLVAAVAIAAAAVGMSGGRADQALAVEHVDGFTTIKLQDAAASPTKLTRELRAAGIKGTVLIAPATHDAVGTWVEVSSPRVLPAGADPSVHDAFDERAEQAQAAARLEGVEVHGDVVRVPAGYPYELTLIAGVSPRAGQEPAYDRKGRRTVPVPASR